MFVFGIFDYVNMRELECLTSLSIEPLPQHIFNFNDFNDFKEVLDLTLITLDHTSLTCINPPVVAVDTLDCRALDDD